MVSQNHPNSSEQTLDLSTQPHRIMSDHRGRKLGQDEVREFGQCTLRVHAQGAPE